MRTPNENTQVRPPGAGACSHSRSRERPGLQERRGIGRYRLSYEAETTVEVRRFSNVCGLALSGRLTNRSGGVGGGKWRRRIVE